jgi:hypothetical protein
MIRQMRSSLVLGGSSVIQWLSGTASHSFAEFAQERG